MARGAHDRITTGFTAAALVVSIVSLGVAWLSNQRAAEANAVAIRADERQDRAERQQFAQLVSLTEAPRWVYEEAGQRPGEIYWAVMNYNPIQITDVWVQGQAGLWIRIGEIPPCSVYTLPSEPGFVAQAAHFEDPYGTWRRDRMSALPTLDDTQRPGDLDNGGNSPRDLAIDNCP